LRAQYGRLSSAQCDALLGIEPKDFDVEVWLAYDQLAALISQHGRVDLVGEFRRGEVTP
jgi:hypothetical protein